MTSYVVKLGGHALDSLSPTSAVLVALASDVVTLREAGAQVVVVHGGGPQIQALLDQVGIESRFFDGLRVTDEASMEYVAMALAQVNLHLVAALNHAGLVSAGISGADHSTLRGHALGGALGRAATTPRVDTTLVTALWRAGVTPVASPVTVDADGAFLNCNADTAAGALAGALDAEALVLLSDVDQLRADALDESSALPLVNGDEVRRLLEKGAAREGMRPKMVAALDALDGGARRVIVANGTKPHALRDALAGTSKTTEVVR
jgi:acetylglutamate kinase